MLEYLRIKNFVIIKDLELEFCSKLNIFTGETGAGKSIIVDAIGLVCGERASGHIVGPFGDKTEIVGVVNLSKLDKSLKEEIKEIVSISGIEVDTELIFRREFDSQGKSKCFINDSIVTVSLVKTISNLLIDIHGQNEHQKLLYPGNQLSAFDIFCKLEEKIKEYKKLYSLWKTKLAELAQVKSSAETQKQKLDLLKFQIEEIEKAKLTSEDELLEEELEKVKNLQKVVSLCNELENLISGENGLLPKLKYIEKQLQILSSLSKGENYNVGPLYSEIENLSSWIERYKKNFNKYTPEFIDSLVTRVDLIKKFKRKYGDSIKDILSYYDKISQEVKNIFLNDEKIQNLTSEIENLYKEIKEFCNHFSDIRQKNIELFTKLVNTELKTLGLEKADFKVEMQTLPLEEENITDTGVDKIDFFISTNPGLPYGKLKDIVSGGELSRIMLAIRTVLGRQENTPVLIFDEIDAGLSGPMGFVVGKKLANLSQDKQIFCVTHLPQLAAFAEYHFFVSKHFEKGKTVVKVDLLDKKTQVKELARMFSGGEITESSVKHANKLLEEVKVYR